VARSGDVLENPATGDRLVFRKTAAETGGEVLEYEITFRPAGFATRDHVHPRQQERHEVVEGSLGIAVDGRERRLGPGDVELVPPNTRHRVFPVVDEPVRVTFESRPALETEVLLETIFGLARDGKVNAKGDPGLLQLAVIFRELQDVGYPTSPPLAVQRALLTPLAMVGRLRGYRARYPSYSGDA
jgi:mannose-6-phosphate isomerase-like protein (cupin superfamily)